jgi:hypothetical protein
MAPHPNELERADISNSGLFGRAFATFEGIDFGMVKAFLFFGQGKSRISLEAWTECNRGKGRADFMEVETSSKPSRAFPSASQ